ncbi:hypothetical protein [Candidatus Enterococcus clewellii]|uniref:Uncharacterized protein n=1 Tax=Candidatus Enterococcus clewellii TaxID=1834193 RepID=A0A242K258_9ENTE|nr:hypothetical protein [Enterococcus sp. 9E7_DIV0242]OTP12671.1 hypothetical protein A5888_003249 [Enterococcus sp. 9E7_DIV0242]
MALEKQFYLSSNVSSKSMGNAVAPWYLNYSKSNWWYDGLDSSNYFYSINSDNVYIQYGQNLGTVPWASARFFGQEVVVNNETENTDGSITANVTVTPLCFSGRRSDYAAPVGFRVIYDIRINGVRVYSFNGSTIDEFTNGAGAPQTFVVTIPPESRATQTALEVNITYPDGEYPNSTTVTGFVLYNPNPPAFRPMAIRKSGKWKSLNNPGGYWMIRKGGIWQEIPLMNYSQAGKDNVGTSRIRKSGRWKGQSIYGE